MSGNNDGTLALHLEIKNNRPQLFGIFDFRVIEGIMRFEKPVPVPKTKKTEDSSKKRKWEENEDGDINMGDLDEYNEYAPYDDGHRSSKNYEEKVFLGPKESLLLDDPTGDIDGVAKRLARVKFSSVPTRKWALSPSATRAPSFQASSSAIFCTTVNSQA